MVIFFPLGHEENRTRRFPVVSAAVVLTCLSAFFVTWTSHERQEEELQRIVQRSMQCLLQLGRADTLEEGHLQEAFVAALKSRSIEEFLAVIERTVSECEAEGLDSEAVAELKQCAARARSLLQNLTFRRWGFVTGAPTFLGLLCHMFLHAGYLHLIFNMIFFFLVAPTLEDCWGRFLFPSLYLLSGVAGALGFWAASGPLPVPLVGASGSIAGLMGAFLVFFARVRITIGGVYFLFFLPRFFTFSLPAWCFFPLWVGWEIIQGVTQLSGAVGGVAHWAHVSGFFFGVTTALFLKFTKLGCSVLYRLGSPETPSGADPATQYQAHEAYRTGVACREEHRWQAAVSAFRELAAGFPQLLDPMLEIVQTYRRKGDRARFKEALRQACERAVALRDPRARDLYADLSNADPEATLSPKALYALGCLYERAGDFHRAAQCLRKLLASHPEDCQAPKAALRLADVLCGKLRDTEAGLEVLKEAQEVFARDPVWSHEISSRLRELQRRSLRRDLQTRAPATRVPPGNAR